MSSRSGPWRPGRHPADRAIWRLALPALGALVAEPLFLLTDSAVVGRLGTDALAALGIASTLLTTLVGVSVFLAYGTTAAVARAIGAGRMDSAMRQGIDGCWLAAIIGVLVAGVGWPAAGPVIEAFGPSAAVAELATTYLQISLIGIPSMLVVLAATGVLRGLQDTRTPLLVAATGAVVNAGLNIVLVHGVGLGIGGAALGTVLAQTGMAVWSIAVVLRGARTHDTRWTPHWAGVRRSFGAGVPLIIRTVAMRVALLLATWVATGMGTAELAAHQVVFTTWTLLALVLDAVAIAAQALVGRARGAGDVDDGVLGVRSLTRRMVQWGVGVGVLLGVVVIVGGGLYAQIFTPDPEVRGLIVVGLVVAAVLQPVAGWVFVLDGVLIGAGDGRYLAGASVLAVLAFLPAGAAVLLLGLTGTAGMIGLWSAIGVWTLARLLTLALRARTDRWTVLGATR